MEGKRLEYRERELSDICDFCGKDDSANYDYLPGYPCKIFSSKLLFISDSQMCERCFYGICKTIFTKYDVEGLIHYFNQKEQQLPQGYKKKKIGSTVKWQVFKRDGFKCLNCSADENLHADHIIPESLGGLATFDNLQTLCKKCNSSKSTKSTDYRKQV